MVLGLRKGSGTENWTSWRPWCQHRANIGQDVGYMGQHKAKIGASLRQHRANIGQDVGYMGRHKGSMGQHTAKIGASLRQHRANNNNNNNKKTKHDDHDNNNNNNDNNDNDNNNNNHHHHHNNNNNNARSGWRVCFCRRPAVRRKPHKSGRRPRARVLAGGLRW